MTETKKRLIPLSPEAREKIQGFFGGKIYPATVAAAVLIGHVSGLEFYFAIPILLASAFAFLVCDSVKHSAKRPRLIVDMLNGGAWHVPGGGSYLGRLFADAGADYLMAQDERSGSVPLSFETVYSKGADADFWLIKSARTGGLNYDIIKQNSQNTLLTFNY